MKDSKTKERFVELRAQGMSYQGIASELGISKQTALKWARELNVEIHNLKALELDTLYEKHFLSNKSRIELFGELLSRVKEELAKRDLSQVATEKLFELMLKVMAAMREGFVGLQFREVNNILEMPDFSKVENVELA